MKVHLLVASFLIAFKTANAQPIATLPVKSLTITSAFGVRMHPVKGIQSFHSGIDLRAASGEAINCIGAGTVIFNEKYRGYGNMVTVLHRNDVVSLYAHLKQSNVRVGDQVSAGDVIGTAGSTGLVTASHLHLEIRVKGIPIDPKQFLETLNERKYVRP